MKMIIKEQQRYPNYPYQRTNYPIVSQRLRNDINQGNDGEDLERSHAMHNHNENQ